MSPFVLDAFGMVLSSTQSFTANLRPSPLVMGEYSIYLEVEGYWFEECCLVKRNKKMKTGFAESDDGCLVLIAQVQSNLQ
jgi:hypothetical protein